MTTLYSPRGKLVPFLEAVKDDKDRVWTVAEVGRVIGVRANGVIPMLTYALRNQVLFRGKTPEGRTAIRGVPFPGQDVAIPPPRPDALTRARAKGKGQWTPDPDDLRIPKVVAGWKPPQMVAPRG